MKIAIINKSDSTGGAAVVSHRLMNALIQQGHDVKMLVTEKLVGDKNVVKISDDIKINTRFIADRLPVFLNNGFNRKSLFKIDGAFSGLPVAHHPDVISADVVIINWINQGVLSLNEIRLLIKSGKRIIWTMHDMWNFTGICHHSEDCREYLKPEECETCPLLKIRYANKKFAHKIFKRKQYLYKEGQIQFVAVSNWLAECARKSTLLSNQKVAVIPNAFPLPDKKDIKRKEDDEKIRLIFVAARLDDEIKDFPTFIESVRILLDRNPELSEKLSLKLIGGIKNESLLNELPIKFERLGLIRDAQKIQEYYEESDIVVSSSSYETLPGTLIEGQAFGCIPVAFDRGGQKDIISDGVSGELAEWDSDLKKRAENLVIAIERAIEKLEGDKEDMVRMRETMYESVRGKFSPESVAASYSNIFT